MKRLKKIFKLIRRFRNWQIKKLHKRGLKPKLLAWLFGLSYQMIYRIVGGY